MMGSTKSRIKWTRNKGETQGEICWYLQGRAEGCDFYIHIYGVSGEWYWSIRSWRDRMNLIVGHETSTNLRDALAIAAKWAIVQFIRQIDPKLFRGIFDDDIIRGEQSITEERLRRGVPWFN